MTDDQNSGAQPALDVDDAVLAKVSAFEAVRTPGVARLHPYAVQAARQAVASAAQQAAARVTGAKRGEDQRAADGDADPAAVDVDRDAETGVVTLTVRVVATTQPPILQVVRELQKRINARVSELIGTEPVVVINILDVDPPDPV